MDIETLLAPVSEEMPCGPDLLASQDAAFDAYYFAALGRLPGYYFQPGVDRPDGSRTPDRFFDTASVDIAAEADTIDALLARSRDLRLLVLRAQWEALTGRIGMFAVAVEAIAALLEHYPDTVHPIAMAERRDALADLNQQIAIQQPLLFYSLTGSGEVTLRKLRVARGQGTALAGDEDLSLAVLSETLADPSNRKRVDAAHAAFAKLDDCLSRIDNACQSLEQSAFTPSFGDLKRIVSEALEAFVAARPELQTETDAPADPPAQEPDAPKAVSDKQIGAVLSHAHARKILEACEQYYRQAEPSSAALLLVTQARLLIGKPLVEAIETLLPAQAAQAVVDFGPQTGFALNMERLRSLTAEGPAMIALAEGEPVDSVPVISDGQAAAGAMRSVEVYFQQAERSSPVPLLLQRARSYADKDFQALVAELIPNQTQA